MKDHSKGLDGLIAGRLRGQLQAESPDCPEAETLAAYVDRTLAQGERESLETHLALCARCQEQVAELVRLTDAEEPAKVFVPARRTAWFRWAFAAPALVGLLVGALWYTGEFRPLLKQKESVALKAPLRPESGPAPAVVKEAEVPPSQPVQQELSKAPLTKKARREAVSELATAALKPSTAEPGGAGAVAGAGVASENLAVPAPGAIAPPSERARLVASAPPAARGSETVQAIHEDRLAARAEAAPPAPAAAPPAKRAKGGEVATAVAGGATSEKRQTLSFFGRDVAAKKVVASSPAGEWKVGRRGLIQKADASGNWITQASGVEVDLFDITFVTPSVGWAVGRAGTVLRTTDGGTTWDKVTIPTHADLLRVTANGELAAIVVTRDGQAFATTDGGKSWKLAPQD